MNFIEWSSSRAKMTRSGATLPIVWELDDTRAEPDQRCARELRWIYDFVEGIKHADHIQCHIIVPKRTCALVEYTLFLLIKFPLIARIWKSSIGKPFVALKIIQWTINYVLGLRHKWIFKQSFRTSKQRWSRPINCQPLDNSNLPHCSLTEGEKVKRPLYRIDRG